MQIPLKKIASKSKYKSSILDYMNRGKDKNGKQKASQAHMELVVAERARIAKELFEEKYDEILATGKIKAEKAKETFSDEEVLRLVDVWMPPEPELDSMIYYVNTGERKSHGDVKTDPATGEKIIRCKMINSKDLEENPDMTGEYNIEKYLDAFNKRVMVLLDGFDEEIREDILVKIKAEKKKDAAGKSYSERSLIKNMFTKDQLVLKNFDADDLEASMYLEEKEVEFWNRTGLNPDRIWDGYKTSETHKLFPEIYEFKVKHVSDIMVKSGKKPVKSVNDPINKGDYVLLKNFDTYNLGYHNGTFIEILRENMDIPASPTEEEMDRLEREEMEKIEKLRVEGEAKVEEFQDKVQKAKDFEVEVFKEFKKKFNLPLNWTMDFVFKEIPEAKTAFNDMLGEKQAENDGIEYFEIDEGDY